MAKTHLSKYEAFQTNRNVSSSLGKAESAEARLDNLLDARRVRAKADEDARIIFAGTSNFALPSLKVLIKNGFNIVAVITTPDKKQGRNQKTEFSPVKKAAFSYKIPVLQPEKIADLKNKLLDLKPDLMIVAAYGQIIPKDILEIPKYKTLNVHGSLLPKYRGPSPIAAAILNNEKETGITIMVLEPKMDAGPIIAQEKIKIEPKDTTQSLSQKLTDLGAKILIETLPLWLEQKIKPKTQDEKKATYCQLIKKEDGKTNWEKPAPVIEREIRAYFPWPGSYTQWKFKTQNSKIKIKKIKIIEVSIWNVQNPNANKASGYVSLTPDKRLIVSCLLGSLEIKKLQIEGKKKMTASEFLNGYSNIIGARLE